MKKIGYLSGILLFLLCTVAMTDTNKKNLYTFEANTLEGKKFDFTSLKGKKVLIVNVASECGYTPQYKQLQELWEKYGPTGKFAILGFPCNQFGGQEPGTAKDIQLFCQKNYGVTFQMMEKIDVKGDKQHPLYKWLTHQSENGLEDSEVRWNFGKYLVNADGSLHGHVSHSESPLNETIINWIEAK